MRRNRIQLKKLEALIGPIQYPLFGETKATSFRMLAHNRLVPGEMYRVRPARNNLVNRSLTRKKIVTGLETLPV